MEKRECSFIEKIPHHINCALAAGAGVGGAHCLQKAGNSYNIPTARILY